MSPHAGKLRLLQLKERNDMKREQLAEQAKRFDALAGQEVKAVSAFNLFQTPRKLAKRMAELLNPQPGQCILEPSAGLGRLADAVHQTEPDASLVLVEQDPDLCSYLTDKPYLMKAVLAIRDEDFLTFKGTSFDGVIMNPPFKQGRDIKHIFHAYDKIKPGGRLVALCYNGVRQNARLKPWADQWQELPQNTFAGEGTSADVCLLVKDKPE